MEFSRWGWAFREQPVADFGIDAHVEPFHDGRPWQADRFADQVR